MDPMDSPLIRSLYGVATPEEEMTVEFAVFPSQKWVTRTMTEEDIQILENTLGLPQEVLDWIRETGVSK